MEILSAAIEVRALLQVADDGRWVVSWIERDRAWGKLNDPNQSEILFGGQPAIFPHRS